MIYVQHVEEFFEEGIDEISKDHIGKIGIHPTLARGTELKEWCHTFGLNETDLRKATNDAIRNRHEQAEMFGINKDFRGTHFTVYEFQVLSIPGVEASYMFKDGCFVILGYQLVGCSEMCNKGRIGLCCRGTLGEPIFASLVNDCLTYDVFGAPQLTQTLKRELYPKLVHATGRSYMARGLMNDCYLGIGTPYRDNHHSSKEELLYIEHEGCIHIFVPSEWGL